MASDVSARGLPRIATYPLPDATSVAPARVTWRPDPERVALLVHDVQNYFVRAFPQGSPPFPQAVANLSAIRDRCDARGIPVFYTAQSGGQDPRDRGLQAAFWGPGMGLDEADTGIHPDLAPREHHVVLTKWRYSAFQRTNLAPLMTARGRDQLIVTGVYAHIGCLLTAAEAFMLDIQPFLVADAVADFSARHHQSALDYVAGHCGRVISTAHLLEDL